MFLPIGHDQGQLRRWPVLTFTIMALCAIMALVPSGVGSDDLRQADEAFAESLTYYLQHLDLKPHRLLRNVALRYASRLPSPQRDELRAKIENPPPGSPLTELRQASLDKKTGIWLPVLQKENAWRWGYIPGQSDGTHLLTYLFVHSGFLHLFFNMLFLYMMGPFIEDQWGRQLFLLFYLTAGVFAGRMFAWHEPNVGVPLVGASGAIAGVMGAFLVRYPKAWIKFWRLFPPGTFSAPAWIVLPLWFLGEFTSARLQSLGMSSSDPSVAYWAHVYGFGFGFVAGLLMRAFKVEEKFVQPTIEAKMQGGRTVMSEVSRLLNQGRQEEACELLERELIQSPSNVDAAISYWNLAAPLGRMEDRSALCQRVIAAALRNGRDGDAVELWGGFRPHVPDGPIDPSLAVPLSRVLDRSGRRQEAADLITSCRTFGIDTDPEVLVECGRRAIALDTPNAPAIVEQILRNPRVPRLVKQSFAPAPDPGAALAPVALRPG